MRTIHTEQVVNVQQITSGEFETRVLQAKGSVLLDFSQATCAPCRALEPRLEQVARQHTGVPVYRIDIEHDLSIANRLGVKSIPTALVFRNGREVNRLDGLITDEQLRRAFENASSP